MKATYNCDSRRVVLNWRALLEPPCPATGPPSTSVVLELVIPTAMGVATRVGVGTRAEVTRVGLGTHPQVPTTVIVVPRALSGIVVVASHARHRSCISAPTGIVGGCVSMLGRGGVIGSLSLDMFDSTIYHLQG